MMNHAGNHPAGASVLRQVFAGVALALLPVACGRSYLAPPVTPQFARMSPAPLAVLERGRRVYQTQCARCHPLENPALYPADALSQRIVPAMAGKAKLAPGDAQAVLAYLLAARQLPEPPASR